MSMPSMGSREVSDRDLAAASVETSGGRTRGRLRRHRSAQFGALVLALYIVATILLPVLIRYNPDHNNLAEAFAQPSLKHLLGTDELGRDELLRLALAARWTLFVGFAAVAIGLLFGLPLGSLSGYYGGWIDLLLQRVTDVLLAFPGILLALALVAGLGVGLKNVIVSVGITSIPSFIRLVRASALSIRELPYVEAARALGVPSWRILLRHVIPNSLAPVIVQATLQLGFAILVAAGLGFLGLGVQPPTPEWGSMLGLSRNYMFSDQALVTYPGLAIFGAVLAFNLLGDGLRDALDPRLK
jgi:ABC-type dipeptide/oligopeptide/nickel transport system permease subunit